MIKGNRFYHKFISISSILFFCFRWWRRCMSANWIHSSAL